MVFFHPKAPVKGLPDVVILLLLYFKFWVSRWVKCCKFVTFKSFSLLSCEYPSFARSFPDCDRQPKINQLTDIVTDLQQITDQTSDLHCLLGAISKPSDVKGGPDRERPLENLTQVVENLPYILREKISYIRTMLSEIKESLV